MTCNSGDCFGYNLNIFQKMDLQNEKKQSVSAPPAATTPEPVVQTLLMQIRDTLTGIDKAVTNKEIRTANRLSRQVRKYRNVIKAHHLAQIVAQLGIEFNTGLLKDSKTFDSNFNGTFQVSKSLQAKFFKVLQIQAFVRTLIIEFLWKEGQYKICLEAVKQLLERIDAANRRTLDAYSALMYFFFSRLHEKNGTDLQQREFLLDAYNRACVRNDELGQSTLLNLLLRNYLRHSHIDAAHNLIEKTSFPEGKSGNEFCKYLYYTGRVKAIRREYADSLNRLNQAIRKSPDSAKGFRLQCQRIAIVVELLMGEVPNREIFTDKLIYAHCQTYFKLIQSVLEGSLANFDAMVQANKTTFQRDRLYGLVLRLNQIVIRIGMRKIYLSYSKISLADVGLKLNIPSQDIEFVVAKALRDGILQGQIDHDKKLLRIEGDRNLYVTNEPQNQLDKRIKFCLNLYHETQKAITYPDMRMKKNEENKDTELDTDDIMNLFDFEDDM